MEFLERKVSNFKIKHNIKFANQNLRGQGNRIFIVIWHQFWSVIEVKCVKLQNQLATLTVKERTSLGDISNRHSGTHFGKSGFLDFFLTFSSMGSKNKSRIISHLETVFQKSAKMRNWGAIWDIGGYRPFIFKFRVGTGSLDCAVQNLELGLWDARNCGRKNHFICEIHEHEKVREMYKKQKEEQRAFLIDLLRKSRKAGRRTGASLKCRQHGQVMTSRPSVSI